MWKNSEVVLTPLSHTAYWNAEVKLGGVPDSWKSSLAASTSNDTSELKYIETELHNFLIYFHDYKSLGSIILLIYGLNHF